MSRKSIHRVQGIGAGLFPRNLNSRALVALRGLSDAPADDIVALLRSDQPIDTKIRQRLADAIEGKCEGVRVRVTNPKKITFVRKLIREFARVRQGRHVRRKIQASERESQESARTAAVQDLAKTMRKSFKTAEACLTLSDQVDRWIREVRSRGDYPEHTETELTVAFLSAHIDDLPPEAGLDDSLPAYVRFVLQFQKIEIEALALQEWFMT